MEGITVLDLTHALAGPFCTYQLQLQGADVIKIERPGAGDDFRDFVRPAEWSVGPAFIAVNAGKRSVTVDLKMEEGQEIVRRLAGRADVVVENFRPGVATNLGLGWDSLKGLNQNLVYCSISGFGQTGPMSDWMAYDHTIQAMSGMMWNGGEDIPTQGRGFSVDCYSGYVAFTAIALALLRRERGGGGQFIDVAMLDSSVVLMGVGIVRQMLLGDSAPAVQAVVHERPTVAPYRTADGWIFLSGNFQHHFEALCRVLGAPELVQDARFSDVRSRNVHSADLKGILATLIATRSATELERQLQEAGCPAARVRTSAEVLHSDQLRQRGMLLSGGVPGFSEPVDLINAGFLLDHDGPALAGPVPALGAHTNEVLSSLGYADAEIERLRTKGVI